MLASWRQHLALVVNSSLHLSSCNYDRETNFSESSASDLVVHNTEVPEKQANQLNIVRWCYVELLPHLSFYINKDYHNSTKSVYDQHWSIISKILLLLQTYPCQMFIYCGLNSLRTTGQIIKLSLKAVFLNPLCSNMLGVIHTSLLPHFTHICISDPLGQIFLLRYDGLDAPWQVDLMCANDSIYIPHFPPPHIHSCWFKKKKTVYIRLKQRQVQGFSPRGSSQLWSE